MKNIGIALIVIFISVINGAQSQTNSKLKKIRFVTLAEKLRKAAKFEKEAEGKPLPSNPVFSNRGGASVHSTTAVTTFSDLGQSTNPFTILGAGRNVISVIPSLNTVAFFRRGGIDDVGGLTNKPGNKVFYDLNTKGGADGKWQLSRGPVFDDDAYINDPTHTAQGGPNNFGSRYPQGALFNPAGNTDTANVVSIGNTRVLDGTNGSWGGLGMGWQKLAAGSVAKQSLEGSSDPLHFRQESMEVTANAVFVTEPIEDLASGSVVFTDKIAVYKFTYNSVTNSIQKTNIFIPFANEGGDYATSISNTVIAFGPDGLTGYLVISAANNAFDSIATYIPYISKTTNGGQTWSSLVPVKINKKKSDGPNTGLDSFRDKMLSNLVYFDANSKVIPATYADAATRNVHYVDYLVNDLDLVVDKNNYAHLFASFAVSGFGDTLNATFPGGITYYPGYGSFNMHLFFNDPQGVIKGELINQNVGLNGCWGDCAGSDNFSDANRPQLSRSQDGSVIGIVWYDTDTTSHPQLTADNNSNPDLWLQRVRVGTAGQFFYGPRSRNITKNSDNDGLALLGNVAPRLLNGLNGNYLLASTIANFADYDPAATTGAMPTQHLYVGNVKIPIAVDSFPVQVVGDVLNAQNSNLAILNTSNVTSVLANSAVCGGSVSSIGSSAVTARGVCWSTAPAPTVALTTKTVNGSGLGTFTSNLTGLLQGTTYYVRAYATNSVGTAYGTQVIFTTTGNTQGVTINYRVDITNYLAGGATLGANGIRVGGNFADQGASVAAGNMVNWSPSDANSAMVDLGNNIWSITVTYPQSSVGSTQIYKFVNNDWGTNEGTDPLNTIATGGCGLDDGAGNINRTLVIPASNQTICYLWDGCTACTASPQVPVVTTSSPATTITSNSATVGGSATGTGISSKGVCYSTSQNPTIAGPVVSSGTGSGSFSSNLSGLQSATLYYARAYATNSAGTAYGNQISFTTSAALVLPTISTSAISGQTQTTANGGGNVGADGGAVVTSRGVCWSTLQNPTVALSTKTSDGNGTGAFSSAIAGLTAGTTYYVRAYAINSVGTAYGNQVQFTTTAASVLATVSTTTASNITENSANSGGAITSDGGSAVTSRGVCWSTLPNPNVSLSTKTNNGTGTGSFTSSITGLNSNTTYYVRAYATNSVGTSYGNQVQFSTLIPANLPTLNTSAVSNIAQNAANSGGAITSDGGASVTGRGVCWSTSPGPTVSLFSKTIDGSGTGTFSSSMTSLNPSTTYYVRAYATNSVGTAYGNELTFTTLSASTIPTINTSTITNITQISANSGGTISSDGGSVVLVRGVCWSTSPSPTVSLSTKTTDGTGTGTFTSSISGLTPATVYYVKAYATNALGTAYGAELTFTTLGSPNLASITTNAISGITSFGALAGGQISTDGGTGITSRGVCWSTIPSPTISLSTKTSDGQGTGSFASLVSGLNPNTTYYLRAYATNSAGTSYGNERSFTTLSCDFLSQISGGNQTLTCLNPTANLSVSGATSLVWSNGASGPSITISPVVTTTYFVVGSQNNGCTDTSFVTISVNKTTPPTPQVTPQSGSQICPGQVANLFSSSSQNNQWYQNSNPIQGATNQIYVASQSGSYFVRVTDPSNGCFSESSTQTIGVLAGPVITQQPTSQTVADGQQAGFSIALQDPAGATFQWQTNLGTGFQNLSDVLIYSGTSTSNLVLSSVSSLNNNQPFRCIVGSGSCLDTSETAILNITTAVSGSFNSKQIVAIPNPSNGKIHFAGLNGNGELILTNILGAEVWRQNIKQDEVLDVSHLATSAYFYTIKTPNGMFKGKLILQ